MQLIFNAFSEVDSRHTRWWKSNVLHAMEIACVYCTSQASVAFSPQLHKIWYPRVLQLVPFLGICLEALCSFKAEGNKFDSQPDWNFPKEH